MLSLEILQSHKADLLILICPGPSLWFWESKTHTIIMKDERKYVLNVYLTVISYLSYYSQSLVCRLLVPRHLKASVAEPLSVGSRSSLETWPPFGSPIDVIRLLILPSLIIEVAKQLVSRMTLLKTIPGPPQSQRRKCILILLVSVLLGICWWCLESWVSRQNSDLFPRNIFRGHHRVGKRLVVYNPSI